MCADNVALFEGLRSCQFHIPHCSFLIPMDFDFAKIRQRYDDTLTKDVIPFWENHAIDKQYGGYFTSLDRDGSVYDTTKYMWMQ